MKITISDIGGSIAKEDERYVVKDNTTLKNLVLSSTDLKPTKATSGHKHKGQEEVYYFIKGSGRMELDDKTISVKENDVVLIEDGGITFSSFDLFHSGHVAMLKEAKANCDHLMVGVQTDPTVDRPEKNKPIQSVFERYVQLEGCKYIDQIVPYATEKEIEDILLTYKIDKRFIGEEYKTKEFTGKQLCVDNDIELYYNKRQHSFSTTNLRTRIVEANK